MGASLLKIYLLHYKQLGFLEPRLHAAEHLDPSLIDFELRDDGSPPEIQNEIRQLLKQHPTLRATLYERNKGVMGMIDQCLADSNAPYTYINACDDAVCPAILNVLLGDLAPGETPLIVTDYYTVDEKSGTSFYYEAALPPALRERGSMSAADFRQQVREATGPVYLASHGLLCPTRRHLEAGGYPPELTWHTDWFAFTVAALRSEIRYSRLPLGCWRNALGTFSEVGKNSTAEVDVLRRLFSILLESRFADVRDLVMGPRLHPIVRRVESQMLAALLFCPRLWRFLRWGYFREALLEYGARRMRPKRVLGRLIRGSDVLFRFLPRLRNRFIAAILRLGGARVGRGVRFGKRFRVSHPRGLSVEDEVVFGRSVTINAIYPVTIRAGAMIDDDVTIEAENKSSTSPVPFVRCKSVVLGERCRIGAGAVIGPGARVAEQERVPPRTRKEDVEDRPLYFLNAQNQIILDRDLLRDYYKLP